VLSCVVAWLALRGFACACAHVMVWWWWWSAAAAFGAANLTVFVAGAAGNTGAATVHSLLKSSPTVQVRAAVRDSKKAAEKFSENKRLTLVSHDVKNGQLSAQSKDNAAELKGVDALVIVLPQVTQDRAGFVSTYAAAAKAAGVKHIVVCSNLSLVLATSNQLSMRCCSAVPDVCCQRAYAARQRLHRL
jgi:hypothetical protein